MRTWTWVLQTLGFLRKSTVETTTVRAVPPSCQWSGLLWKAWQIICTQHTAMWWVLHWCFEDHLYSCWSGVILLYSLRVGKGPGDGKGVCLVWGAVLPLPSVMLELKTENMWEWFMSEDMNPFSVVLWSFIFQYLSPPSPSPFPFSLLFLSTQSLCFYSSFSFLICVTIGNVCNPHAHVQVQQRYSLLQKALVELHGFWMYQCLDITPCNFSPEEWA